MYDAYRILEIENILGFAVVAVLILVAFVLVFTRSKRKK